MILVSTMQSSSMNLNLKKGQATGRRRPQFSGKGFFEVFVDGEFKVVPSVV